MTISCQRGKKLPQRQQFADKLQVFILISLKMVMDSARNGRWIIPFKKFGMVRVNISRIHTKFTNTFESFTKNTD